MKKIFTLGGLFENDHLIQFHVSSTHLGRRLKDVMGISAKQPRHPRIKETCWTCDEEGHQWRTCPWSVHYAAGPRRTKHTRKSSRLLKA